MAFSFQRQQAFFRRFFRRRTPVWQDVHYAKLTLEGANSIGNFVKLSGTIYMGYASTLGGFNQIVGGTVRVGRYCQLAPHAAIYALNHPLDYITTYVSRSLLAGRMKVHQRDEPVELGNDVWVGHGATLLPGVKVGNGAVIGAGAIVTKSVDPYAIVGGCPATQIKKRFSGGVIKLLEELRWWELKAEQLTYLSWLFDINLKDNEEATLSKLKEAIEWKYSHSSAQ